jgi:hypothetical protein
MFSADVVEYFFGGASESVGYVIKALTDTFHGVGTGRNVEQALIGLGILHDSRCFALHRKHHGALTLLELFHEVMKSPERRRKVVKDWVSLVMSSMGLLLLSTFLGARSRIPPRCEVEKASPQMPARNLRVAAGEDLACMKAICTLTPQRISEGADPPRFGPKPTGQSFGSNLVANCAV